MQPQFCKEIHIQKVKRNIQPNGFLGGSQASSPTEDSTMIYDVANGDIFGSPNSVDTTTDEECETGNGNSDENMNFWSLLVEETARKLHNDRLARGQPGPVPSIQSVHEFEGKHLSLVMEYLKDRYRDIKEICGIRYLVGTD